MICISVVSHGHGHLLPKLFKQLIGFSMFGQIILTLNTVETKEHKYFGPVCVVKNPSPLGFGENHNNAFKLCNQPYFCVLNPDIEFVDNPFLALVQCLSNTNHSLVAPVILSPDGSVEDSARYYPSVGGVIKKLVFRDDGRWPINFEQPINHPDWVAGMFMLFKSEAFKEIGGFDIKYFLYYEDVDICRRLKNHGHQLGLCTSVSVIHDARRTSRKNLRYMLWHLKSMLRFLFLRPR